MIRAMAYDEELAGRVRAALADRTDVEEKKMFGGLSFMVAGQMCCGVLKNDLVVRIEPAEFDKLVAQPHVRPFDFTGRPMQGTVYVDNGTLADPEVLRTWVHCGTDYVAAHSAAAARRRKSASRP
jgi:TfoX/Sxy family transcriptional regulator of competence genes